jgi:hypothetical protein
MAATYRPGRSGHEDLQEIDLPLLNTSDPVRWETQKSQPCQPTHKVEDSCEQPAIIFKHLPLIGNCQMIPGDRNQPTAKNELFPGLLSK